MPSFSKPIRRAAENISALSIIWLFANKYLVPSIIHIHQELVATTILIHLVVGVIYGWLVYRTYWQGGSDGNLISWMLMAMGTLLLSTGLWQLSIPANVFSTICFLGVSYAGLCVMKLAVKIQWTLWFN